MYLSGSYWWGVAGSRPPRREDRDDLADELDVSRCCWGGWPSAECRTCEAQGDVTQPPGETSRGLKQRVTVSSRDCIVVNRWTSVGIGGVDGTVGA